MHAVTSSDVVKSFPRHQHLAKEGAVCESIYRIKHGWACRYVMLPDGRRQITNLYLPGNYCEPQWLLSGRATASVMALTAVTATRVPLAHIHRSQSSDVKDVLGEMVQSYERQTQWLVRLGRGTGIYRVAGLLDELCNRMPEDEQQLLIPLTQMEIADCVGLTAIHTNRVLHTLTAEGFVKAKGRTILLNRSVFSLTTITEAALAH